MWFSLSGHSTSAAAFPNAGSHKGERAIAEVTFSVAPKVYLEVLHFHSNPVQLTATWVCEMLTL